MSSQMEKEDLAFVNYCKKNDITPLNQDKVIMNPIIRKSRGTHFNQSSAAYINTPSMFIYGDSKDDYCVDGQNKIIKDLRLGKYKIIASIDLHNYTQASALDELEDFINNNSTYANSCLKIIHGKGLNAPEHQGVLKNLVRRYLEQHQRILAYTKAGNNAGGDGVTLVKFKN